MAGHAIAGPDGAGRPGRAGRFGAVLVALWLAQATACGTADEVDPGPALVFDTAEVVIETVADTFRLTVELAETAEQRSYGLMDRDSLPEDHGMLFVYDGEQPPTSSFYMFRTRIPLDIAFLDADGRIVSARAMEPCRSPNPSVCLRYPAGAPFHAALEVSQGYLARHGIRVGDRVVGPVSRRGP